LDLKDLGFFERENPPDLSMSVLRVTSDNFHWLKSCRLDSFQMRGRSRAAWKVVESLPDPDYSEGSSISITLHGFYHQTGIFNTLQLTPFVTLVADHAASIDHHLVGGTREDMYTCGELTINFPGDSNDQLRRKTLPHIFHTLSAPWLYSLLVTGMPDHPPRWPASAFEGFIGSHGRELKTLILQNISSSSSKDGILSSLRLLPSLTHLQLLVHSYEHTDDTDESDASSYSGSASGGGSDDEEEDDDLNETDEVDEENVLPLPLTILKALEIPHATDGICLLPKLTHLSINVVEGYLRDQLQAVYNIILARLRPDSPAVPLEEVGLSMYSISQDPSDDPQVQELIRSLRGLKLKGGRVRLDGYFV
jgi:hypothetical protein